MSSTGSPTPSTTAITLQILAVVFFSFLGYLCTGIPLAVLPGYVHQELGFSSTVAGLAIGLQYFATLLGRPLAGRIADTYGPKKGMLYGLSGIAVSGALTLLAILLEELSTTSLLILLAGRVVLGAALSIIGISALSWGISRVGAEHTARVISWNGIAAYAAIGIGAPLGVFMADALGVWSIGAALTLLATVALALLLPKPAIPVIPGERLPFMSVLWRVSPYGMGLALGSIGYGTLTTFITLYYASRGWGGGAAYCLTAFGIAFIAARLLFINSINRLGGFNVAIACLGIEALGLALLWLTPSPALALVGAALAGFGLSLVYPALGMEVLASIPASNRSAGLGAYAIFFDLALGIAGPLMGAVAGSHGYASTFLVSALLSAAGMLLSLGLALRRR
ncbi:putative MFS-type transporter YhhS [compost metagenome]